MTKQHKREREFAEAGIRISEDGLQVIRKNGNLAALRTNTSGYLFFIVGNSRKHRSALVHRFQAWFKFGEAMYADKILCRHLDGNPLNNHAANIAIGTDSDNRMDIPAESRRRTAWIASRSVIKHDHVAIIAHYREHGFRSALREFGISSKGTLSFIINKSQTGVPVPKAERPKRQKKVA